MSGTEPSPPAVDPAAGCAACPQVGGAANRAAAHRDLCDGGRVARSRTLSIRTLLTARDHVPFRKTDRMERLLQRFGVTFHAAYVSRGTYQLQRGNLVLWLPEGTLQSVEVTASSGHEPSDLVDWEGFPLRGGDPLAWCRDHGVELSLRSDEGGAQLWATPSGALMALQDGQLRNITLAL